VGSPLAQNPVIRFTAGLVLGLLVGGILAAVLLTVTGTSFGASHHVHVRPPHTYPYPPQRGDWGN
jgi:hypothetical protein